MARGGADVPAADVVAVRGGHQRRDAVRHGMANHRDGVVIRSRAIIDVGEDMRMQVDHLPAYQ